MGDGDAPMRILIVNPLLVLVATESECGLPRLTVARFTAVGRLLNYCSVSAVFSRNR